jgi:hypothetical protein
MDLARYATELVRRLTMADRSEDFADLFAVLLRELAKGTPVSPATLSATLGWPAGRVATALEHAVGTEWDDDGNVVGYGLTLRETAHAFEVDGRRLYAEARRNIPSAPDDRTDSRNPDARGDPARHRGSATVGGQLLPGAAVCHRATDYTCRSDRGAMVSYAAAQ